MNKIDPKKETIQNENLENNNELGADPDEQAINGLYGMLETEYEDSLHDSPH